MKKYLRRLAVIILITACIPSCSLFEDCKTCYQEKNDNGTITKITTGVPTCGDALKDKENEDPTVIGNVSTYWVCN